MKFLRICNYLGMRAFGHAGVWACGRLGMQRSPCGAGGGGGDFGALRALKMIVTSCDR